MGMALVEADSASYNYAETDAVRDFSMTVERGEIVGLIGPNGAGKSTAVKLMTGQLDRESGEITVKGIDPGKRPREVRERCGILPEREDPPTFLTVGEYMDYISEVRETEFDMDEWLERLNLDGREDELTGELSKGERQKLMVVQSFFFHPEVAFIDEPLINLDPVIQEEVKDIIREHVESGGALVLSTHVIQLAEELCDRVYLIEDGETRELDHTDNLLEEFR